MASLARHSPLPLGEFSFFPINGFVFVAVTCSVNGSTRESATLTFETDLGHGHSANGNAAFVVLETDSSDLLSPKNGHSNATVFPCQVRVVRFYQTCQLRLLLPSAASSRVQWEPPDRNGERQIAVGTTGPDR